MSALSRLLAGAGMLLLVAVAPTGPAATASFIVAVLAVVVVVVAQSVLSLRHGIRPAARARTALERTVPRAAQSDPNARGHARPRAPGRPLTAV